MKQKQFKDYYAILEVPFGATSAQIKRAYREMALACHPDMAGEKGAEKFILVKEAYDVFCDSAQKEEYDTEFMLRASGGKESEFKGIKAHHDLSFVKERIKKRKPGNGYPPIPPPKITLVKNRCAFCNGRGVLQGKYGLLKTCAVCKGTGRKQG